MASGIQLAEQPGWRQPRGLHRLPGSWRRCMVPQHQGEGNGLILTLTNSISLRQLAGGFLFVKRKNFTLFVNFQKHYYLCSD